MNLDSARGMDALRTEPVKVNGAEAILGHVVTAGDPISGGALTARQDGDQYTIRVLKADYKAPAVHDSLVTANYGTLHVKQAFLEGDHWAILATGAVRGLRGT